MKEELLLLFPPSNILVSHPELGIPQLTANLRKRGVKVSQRDLNMEFQYRFLVRPEVLRALMERCFPSKGAQPLPKSREGALKGLAVALNKLKPAKLRAALKPDPLEYMNRRAAENNILSNVKESVELPGLPEAVKTAKGKAAKRALESLREPGVWKGLVELVDGLLLQPPSASEADAAAAAAAGEPLLESFYKESLDGAFSDGVPAAVGITLCTFTQLVPAMVLARLIKERSPDTAVFAGGTWCTAARDVLPGFDAFFGAFDAAIIHEGELPLARLLELKTERSAWPSVPGVITQGRAPAEPEAPVPLGELAFPVYDGMPMELYPMRTVSVRLMRGCHWAKCTFCYHVYPGYTECHSTSEEEVDQAHLDALLGHMEEVQEDYGVTHFTLADNGAPSEVLLRFARALNARRLGVTWESLARFEDGLPDGYFKELSASGCRELFFGLETVSAAELDSFSKGIDLDTADACLTACSENRIASFVFVLCHPFQSRASLRKTLRWTAERAGAIYKVILFRFCLARFSRAFRRLEALGLSLLPGAERWLDVFCVPHRRKGELRVASFLAEAARAAAGEDGLREEAVSGEEKDLTGQSSGSSSRAPKGLMVWGCWPPPPGSTGAA